MFPVVVAANGEYPVVGGPGGQYRLQEVDLFAVFEEGARAIQITFEHKEGNGGLRGD